MAKATQARNRQGATKRKLEKQRDEAAQHIDNIDRERSALAQRDQQLAGARSEMMGRLRFIAEELGEVEPLPAPAAPGPQEEPEPQPDEAA